MLGEVNELFPVWPTLADWVGRDMPRLLGAANVVKPGAPEDV